MKTITLNIDDDIFDKVLGFLGLLPKDKIKVFQDLISVNDEEQREIEEALQNPECHELSGYSKIIEI